MFYIIKLSKRSIYVIVPNGRTFSYDRDKSRVYEL